MASVFFRQNKMDVANSLYTEVGKTKGCPLHISPVFSCALSNVFPAFNIMVTISSAGLAF